MSTADLGDRGSVSGNPEPGSPMHIRDILSPSRVACAVQASSKKKALEKLAELLATSDAGLTVGEVFDCLHARERLGSTGLGQGVAIPHGRMRHVPQAVGAFIKMSAPVAYDAIDQQPVDLLFALLVPEHSTDEHLQLLAQLAEMLSEADFRERLRQTEDCQRAFALISDWNPAS